MGYFRHITVDSLPVEGANIAIDENRAALRFLQSVPKEELPQHWTRCEASQLLTTEELGRPHFDPASIKTFYEIEEVFWVVTNEIILDKRYLNTKEYGHPAFILPFISILRED